MEKKEETKKAGLLGRLSKLVFEERDSETNEKENESATVIDVNTASKFNYSSVAQNQTIGMVMPNSNGVFDQKFYDSFLKIIEDNNIEGIDYCEFAKAKKANDNIIGLQDAVKFQMAFNTLKANSPTLTKDRILDTANFYIEKLDEEEKNFNAEMQNEINAEVNSKLSQAKSKQEYIVKKQEQIAQLQAEIGQLNNDIGTLSTDAQTTQVKIENTAKNFKVSLEIVKGQINQDKISIQQLIQ